VRTSILDDSEKDREKRGLISRREESGTERKGYQFGEEWESLNTGGH
jgi:hypothetical protein